MNNIEYNIHRFVDSFLKKGWKINMKVLGAFGSKTKNSQVSSYLLDENTAIDAGNLIPPLGDDFLKLDNLLITHAHIDHLVDLPLAIDSYYGRLEKPLNIFATKGTIEIIQENIFNNKVWPDFSKIPLINGSANAIVFHEIENFKEYNIGNFLIKPYPNFHTEASCGFVINNKMLFTSDTFVCYFTWKLLNEFESIKKLVIEVSFPTEFNRLSVFSKHLSPALLKDELEQLERDDVEIYINHLKYEYYDQIVQELKDIGLYDKVTILEDNSVIDV